MLTSRKFVSVLLVALLVSVAPLCVSADNPFAKPWTTVASAGTVDEADL